MAKTIIICSDGTGQGTDSKYVSNVIRLCEMLDLKDRNKQICCYDGGLGTLTTKGGLKKLKERAPLVDTFEDENIEQGLLKTPKRLWKITTDLTIGKHIAENIEQLYCYIAKNYNEGDQIYLFGFSRGAFTVRVLAGFLDRCGLLPLEQLHRYPNAYNLYEKQVSESEYDKFKKDNVHCRIRFLGLWDTVKAYGYFKPRGFRKTRHNTSVDIVRHALSLDERRSTFLHTTWGWGASDKKGKDSTLHCNVPVSDKLDIKEVWFPGDHSDVGGGWPENESGLAIISLKWMIGEAWEASKDELPLLIDKNKYEQLLKLDSSPSPDNQLYQRHDRLADWRNFETITGTIGFNSVNWIPRCQLINCPLPPRLEPWLIPSGKREIDDSMREGKILFHETVEAVYGKSRTELFEVWKLKNRLATDIDIKAFKLVESSELTLPR